MPVTKYLRFYDPNQIDWLATEDEILSDLHKNHPEMRLANRAMLVAVTIVELKKIVAEKGIRQLYDEIEGSKEE